MASFSLHIWNLWGWFFSAFSFDDTLYRRPCELNDAFNQSIADGFELMTFALRLRAGTSEKTWSARTT